MTDLKGVHKSTKKDGTIYYRSSITYKNKHISLGSYSCQTKAHEAYLKAAKVLFDGSYDLMDQKEISPMSFEKWVILMNFRDNGLYFKNPIYLYKTYFSYFVHSDLELKFDIDDLFYYSNHKIFQKKGKQSDLGYLFVNDFGMQINILSRYGIKNHGVMGKDYHFIDGDFTNFSRSNIEVINPYYGVELLLKEHQTSYLAKINIEGKFVIGYYDTEIEAAIAYNKAADFISNYKISSKMYPRNYIVSLSKETYEAYYKRLSISHNILILGYQNQ